jgi:hypothetical protein
MRLLAPKRLRTIRVPRASAVIAALVALRILPELTDSLSLGFGVHGIALAMMMAWLWRLGISPGDIPENVPSWACSPPARSV